MTCLRFKGESDNKELQRVWDNLYFGIKPRFKLFNFFLQICLPLLSTMATPSNATSDDVGFRDLSSIIGIVLAPQPNFMPPSPKINISFHLLIKVIKRV